MSDTAAATHSPGPAAAPTSSRTAPSISELPFVALGGQPAFEPAELERFVAAARVAVMAYVRRDGRPGQAPIWYVYSDGMIHLSTGGDSAKVAALQRDPRVCVTIQDERSPYRAVIFDAVAEIHDSVGETATTGIEERYFGRIGGRKYREISEESFVESGRTEIVLRPTDVRGFDNTRLLSRATVAFLRVRPHLPFLRNVL